MLSLKQSGLITNTFDTIYKNEFQENGYFIITYPIEILKKEFFYDAPYLTP